MISQGIVGTRSRTRPMCAPPLKLHSTATSAPSCSCKLLAQHQPVLDCLALARPPLTLLKENLNVAKQRPSVRPSSANVTTRPVLLGKNFWHCSRSAKIRFDFLLQLHTFNGIPLLRASNQLRKESKKITGRRDQMVGMIYLIADKRLLLS